MPEGIIEGALAAIFFFIDSPPVALICDCCSATTTASCCIVVIVCNGGGGGAGLPSSLSLGGLLVPDSLLLSLPLDICSSFPRMSSIECLLPDGDLVSQWSVVVGGITAQSSLIL